MIILNFNKFKVLELHKMDNLLKQLKVYELLVEDNEGKHFIKCRLSEYGWSLHREVIYYQFTVVESDSENYRIGGEMILGLNFDGRENQFHFYPYFNEVSPNQMTEKTIKALIKIV
jgi:hypothetical protein